MTHPQLPPAPRYAAADETPLRDPRDPNGVDESTDAYDTADWLVKHVPNTNGRHAVLWTPIDQDD